MIEITWDNVYVSGKKLVKGDRVSTEGSSIRKDGQVVGVSEKDAEVLLSLKAAKKIGGRPSGKSESSS